MLIPKHNYIRDRKYRKWLSTLSCVVTDHPDTQAAHIKYKGMAGMSKKSSDNRCLPLYHMEHTVQHSMTEKAYWSQYGGIEAAIELAEDLYRVRYNDDKAHEIIREWRKLWMK